MLFTKDIDIFGSTLDNYKCCFTKPQWNYFTTYVTGLFLGEKGEKNIQDIAENLLDGKDQSSSFYQTTLLGYPIVQCFEITRES